jgi:hypothetical protein
VGPYGKPLKLTNEHFKGVSARTLNWFNQCTIWQPKEGDWCWFYKGYPSNEVPVLNQFSHKDYQYHTKQKGCYNHCEPFIGILPERCIR